MWSGQSNINRMKSTRKKKLSKLNTIKRNNDEKKKSLVFVAQKLPVTVSVICEISSPYCLERVAIFSALCFSSSYFFSSLRPIVFRFGKKYLCIGCLVCLFCFGSFHKCCFRRRPRRCRYFSKSLSLFFVHICWTFVSE